MNEFWLTGAEGRAGMAAIVDEYSNLDLVNLAFQLQKSLPPYARPLFVRTMKAVDTTGRWIWHFHTL